LSKVLSYDVEVTVNSHLSPWDLWVCHDWYNWLQSPSEGGDRVCKSGCFLFRRCFSMMIQVCWSFALSSL
jgi:hypothetical protein